MPLPLQTMQTITARIIINPPLPHDAAIIYFDSSFNFFIGFPQFSPEYTYPESSMHLLKMKTMSYGDNTW